MAPRLFSLCLLIYVLVYINYYVQHHSLGVLHKLTWLVVVSYLMPYIYSVSSGYLEGF